MNLIKLSDRLLDLFETTLRVDYLCGDVTRVAPPHSTGWRVLSEAVCAFIPDATSRLEVVDEPVRAMQPGEAFLMPPGLRHCVTNTSGTPFVSQWVHFQATVFNTVDAFRFFAPPRVWRGSAAVDMGRLCAELATVRLRLATERPAPLSQLVQRKALGFRLFSLIAEGSRPCEGAGLLLDALQRLGPVLARLEAAPDAPMSLNTMARLACLSPSRFSALFRGAMGVPPGSYQRQQRLNRAKSQLVHTEKSVAQIALEAGFPDPFHFSRAFKQAADLAPRAYRAQLRQGMW